MRVDPMHLLPDDDDIGGMFAEVAADIGPDPLEMSKAQALRARQHLADMAAGKGVRWHFRTLHRLTGRLLPGAVFVGGYPKVAKTTLLQTQSRAWAEQGVKVCYIGTETSQEILKLQSAAITLGLPVSRTIAPDEDDQLGARDLARVHADLERQDELAADGRLMYAEDDAQTLASALYWLRWGRRHGADVVIYDHVHRMDLGTEAYYTALANALVALTRAATVEGVVFLIAAQLREDKHDKLANHEVPGDGQWFGGSTFQREGTVNLQLYRPFRAGVTDQDKHAFRHGETPLADLLARDTIGLRCSAHRTRPAAVGELARLRIRDDQITDWPQHNAPPPPPEDWYDR